MDVSQTVLAPDVWKVVFAICLSPLLGHIVGWILREREPAETKQDQQ